MVWFGLGCCVVVWWVVVVWLCRGFLPVGSFEAGKSAETRTGGEGKKGKGREEVGRLWFAGAEDGFCFSVRASTCSVMPLWR